MSPTHLTKEDNGKTITTKVGEEFVVTLKGNPTTGYQWARIGFEKDENPSDATFKVIREYKAPQTGMMGAGGEYDFHVTPLLAGTHELKLEYLRVFEGNKAENEHFTVTFNTSP